MVMSEHVNLPGMTLHPLYTFMVELDIDKACGSIPALAFCGHAL